MRMNPKTLEPECFEVHGVHNFTFRIGIEDALKNRSFISKLRPSHDIALPVLNYYIDEISRPIFNDLFFYFMENSLRLSYAGGQVTQVTELQRGIEKELDIKERREKLFDFYTKQFTKEEVELMKLLVGRNIELAFICLTVAHLLGIKILDFIRALLIAKQSDEDIPDSFYYEKLIEFLSELYTNKKDSWTLKKGEYEGCFYYPKNSVFGEFVKWLKEKDIVHIGNSKFTGLLKDAGFIEGLNWKNQKNIKGTSIRCLIFDKDIMKKLQITDNKPLKKSLLDKWHASHYNKSELHADFLKNVFGFTDNDIEKALKNGQIMEVSPNTYKLT